MSDEGWVYSLETEDDVEKALNDAEMMRDKPRSYVEIASDKYTEQIWKIFNFIGGLDSENSVNQSTEYQKIGSDIIPKNRNAKERLETALENQELDYEITA